MTIAELIEALKAYPLDTKVFINGMGQDEPMEIDFMQAKRYDEEKNARVWDLHICEK